MKTQIQSMLAIIMVALIFTGCTAQQKNSKATLTFKTQYSEGISGIENMGGATKLVVSPDNKNVYVTAIEDNALLVFTRNTNTGELTFTKSYKDGVDGIDGLEGAMYPVVSPDNKFVYVTSQKDHAIVVFNRDINTGDLTFSKLYTNGVGEIEGLDYPMGIAISPDNKNVYVASFNANALLVFQRNITNGDLIFYEVIKNQESDPTIKGLTGAAEVAVSPDNKYVYVGGFYDSSLVVFTRDLETGHPEFSTYFKDGENGVDGLAWPSSIAVSLDNKSVYVAGLDGVSLAMFTRAPISGFLKFSNVLNREEGFWAALSVTVSPDNKNVYLASYADDMLAVYNRDLNTGALTFEKLYKSSDTQLKGLEKTTSIAISPDNKNLYSLSYDFKTLMVFDRN